MKGAAGTVSTEHERAAQDTAAPAAEARRFAPFHYPAFRALWFGLVIANVGSQMQVAGQWWLVRELHEDPVYLGLVGLATGLPMLLTPVGGAVADRLPPVRLLTLARAGMMLQSVLLAVLTLGGWVELWHIMVLTFLNSLLLAVDNPARQALLPDLVPREHLGSAVSLFSIVWSGAALFGPAIGGLLLASIGTGGLFAVAAAAYLVILFALGSLRTLSREHTIGPSGSLFAGVVEGFRYALREPLVWMLLTLLTTTALLGRSYIVLMPVFARDVLNVGPEQYGLLLAAPGAGAIIGGFTLGAARQIRRRDLVALGGLFGFTLTLVLFALSRSLLLSLTLLLLSGLFSIFFTASAAAILQLHTPRHVRGRVMSLVATSNIGGSNIGGLLSAAAASVLGAPLAVVLGGGFIALAGVALGFRREWRDRATQDATTSESAARVSR